MAKKDPAIKKMEAFLKNISSGKEMRLLGKRTITLIRNRTRNEYKGVAKAGGNKRTIKRVTDNYAKLRKKIKGKHPKAASGNKSNLTLTGAMLNKMTVISATKKNLLIGWRDRKNNDKASGQAEQGRPFLFIGRADFTAMHRQYEKRIEKLIKKI